MKKKMEQDIDVSFAFVSRVFFVLSEVTYRQREVL